MPMVLPNGFVFGNFNNPYLTIFHPDATNIWPSNTIRWYINGREGLAYSASTINDIIGNELTLELSNNNITINGETSTTRVNPTTTYANFGIGYGFSNGYDFGQPIRWEYFQVYNGETLVYDLVPAYNDNKYCFLNRVNNTYIYAVGNVDGEVSSINVSYTGGTIASTGGTASLTVDSVYVWTASTSASWVTLSSLTGDTGVTTITATLADNTGDRRSAVIEFINVTGDTANITINQKKVAGAGQPVYLGAEECAEMYLGVSGVTEAYLGEDLVFSSGPFAGLKTSPRMINFSRNSLTANLKVKSSEPWSMTIPSWITASTLTGDTGETIVNLATTELSATTTDDINITTANFSASVNVTYLYAYWEYITSANYDRTKPITKIRFHMNNIPAGTPALGATEACFSELPNKDTDNLMIFDIDQATYGYPRFHKFNMVYNGGRYTNDFTTHTNTTEYPITSLTRVETGVYELDLEGTVYWSGGQNGANCVVYTAGNLVEVYVG